jgi:hypothetical protein
LLAHSYTIQTHLETFRLFYYMLHQWDSHFHQRPCGLDIANEEGIDDAPNSANINNLSCGIYSSKHTDRIGNNSRKFEIKLPKSSLVYFSMHFICFDYTLALLKYTFWFCFCVLQVFEMDYPFLYTFYQAMASLSPSDPRSKLCEFFLVVFFSIHLATLIPFLSLLTEPTKTAIFVNRGKCIKCY